MGRTGSFKSRSYRGWLILLVALINEIALENDVQLVLRVGRVVLVRLVLSNSHPSHGIGHHLPTLVDLDSGELIKHFLCTGPAHLFEARHGLRKLEKLINIGVIHRKESLLETIAREATNDGRIIGGAHRIDDQLIVREAPGRLDERSHVYQSSWLQTSRLRFS